MKKIEVLIYIMLGVFLLSFLFLLFSWGYSSFERISSQNLQSEHRELKTKEKDFLGLRGSLKEWEEIDKFYAKFKTEYLIKFNEFPNFRNELDKILKKNHLKSSSLNFKIHNLMDKIVRVSITFVLSGPYQNIKKFIFDIEKNAHLVFINNIKLSRSKNDVSGRFSMEVYFVR